MLTVDSYTYLYKIGVDELQGHLNSMGFEQGHSLTISSTPTVITVRKNSPNQWSNPSSIFADQQTYSEWKSFNYHKWSRQQFKKRWTIIVEKRSKYSKSPDKCT